ncbi:chromosome partitioning protein ParA [Paraburkholderia lacunae]|uniref:Chromosome partitioning protein ParA n=1 Tax=Paraburkholderia lacunae TaxID=2211104 RepID=A0A370NAT8_9BURK|nr:DNA-binding protein [Paraburkholderia lacunae]RDK02730.1 chromosome partitioning protein ParA [Paraburkholderia lacunae]
MSTNADTITDEMVAGIADRMVDEGRKVSPVTIWPEIPGGSIVAIAAALQRWREARLPLTPHVQVQAGLPGHIAETMMSAADRLWMAAQGEADRAVSQQLSVVNQHLDAVRAERDEVLLEYQKTAEEVATGRERHIALTNALSASEDASTRLTAELASATGRAEAAEARAEELAQRVSVEEATLEHTKAELDEERKARGELAAAVSSQNDEIARMKQELDEARKEIASLGYECQAKLTEADRALQEASAASSRAQAATAQANESLARVAALEAERDEARTALAAEHQTSAARSEEASIQFEELQRVGRELGAAREQLGAVTEANAAVSAELARVSHDASVASERAEAAEQHATTLQQRLVEVEQANSAEAQRWTQEVSAASSRAEAAAAQVDESLARVVALEAELDESRTALAAERQTSAARSEEASNQRDELQGVARQLEEAREQVSTMTAAKTAAIAELAQVWQDASAAKERADAAEQRAETLALRVAEVEKARAEEARRSLQLANQAGESASAEKVAELQRQISAQAKAHEKAFNELRAIAEQWVAHAKDLKERLGSANEKLLFIDSRSTGEVALIRKLSSELERLKPDSELISRDAQQKLIGATMAERLSQKGYRYDPTTAAMSKVER